MENLKSKIIPSDLKKDIDVIMERQLFNANRYYAESNLDISRLMGLEFYNSPEVYFRRLVDRWNWHNVYYENLLEPAYLSLVRNKYSELSPNEIEDLISIYYTSCLVDEATLVMSGSIKKYLEYNIDKISLKDENLSTLEAGYMLITPPVETFFAQYQIDHLYYIYLLNTKSDKAFEYRNYLKKKYHANDDIIFEFRFRKKFGNKFNLTNEELIKDIEGYKISDVYKTKHFYFTLEHSDRKAFRDIIIYDNLYEKLIASNLIGVSGFLLRRKILEYLNDSKILINNGYIYEFNNSTIIESLERLMFERRIQMDKDIKPYRQRGDTCAVACLMMVLEYYNIIEKANWHDEKRLYKIYGSKYMDGTPFSALAYHLSKNGLDTTIYHSENNLFSNERGLLSEETFSNAMSEYKEFLYRAESSGTKILNGVEIDADLIRRKLEDGNIVILAGEVIGGYHAVLISGYDNDKFIVCDPLCKTKQIWSFNRISSFMDTSIGKWFISVSNNNLEKQKLISNLEQFNDDAKNLMKNNNRRLNYVKK